MQAILGGILRASPFCSAGAHFPLPCTVFDATQLKFIYEAFVEHRNFNCYA